MERRLFVLMSVGGLLALAFGIALLARTPAYLALDWMRLKLVLVALLASYHFWCYRLMAALAQGRGAHQLTFGYDYFNDQRAGDNHQSGSDWHIWTTTSLIENGTVYPVASGDGSTWLINWPVDLPSRGTDFRTHSLFLNDSWQLSSNLTVNLGLRWDKNQGEDAAGKDVVRDSAFSPRLGLVWDPTGEGRWSINGSYGRYVAAIANVVADSSSPAGTPSIFAWFYEGPGINTQAGAPLVSSPDAIRAMFDWFNANGGEGRSPFFVDVPGVATQVPEGLRSPHADEYVLGVSRQIGSRGALRADFIVRDFGGFYSQRVDRTTGTVTDDIGRVFDVNLVENYTCKSERNYTQYCNPEVDKLIDAQSRESDLEKRKKLVWEVERVLAEELARPIIYHDRAATCWHPHLKGFVQHANSIYNNWRFEDVWLDK